MERGRETDSPFRPARLLNLETQVLVGLKPTVPRCIGLGFSPDSVHVEMDYIIGNSTFPPFPPILFSFPCFTLFFFSSSPSSFLPSVSKMSGLLAGIKHAFDSVEFMTKLWA